MNPRTGQLRVKPSEVGLFVFAIKIKEYRRGRKIGEMNRDFQMKVVQCPNNQLPSIRATVFGPVSTAPALPANATMTLPLPGQPGERCLNVFATDVERNSLLRFRIVSLDSVREVPGFSVTAGLVNDTGIFDSLSTRDSLYTRLCFSDCFTFSNDTMHFLLIAEDRGCPEPGADTVRLNVRIPIVDEKLFVPNIITPNGDGLNDILLPGKFPGANPCYPVSLKRLRVYSRWGREVFNTTDEKEGWTGKDCPVGVYYYFLEYPDHLYKGWIELFR